LGRVPFMDATGLYSLSEVIDDLAKRQVKVVLCEANERVQKKLQRAGLLPPQGKATHHRDLATAIRACCTTQPDS
jgi:sulfate permease, SulP family